MPTYVYRCTECKSVRDIIKRINDLNRPEACYVCVGAMERLVVPVMVKGDLPGYDCPITGARIEGRLAHQENLKKHGCRLYEDGETQAAARFRRQEDEALDAAVEATAEEFVHTLPIAKREQLITELQAGANAEIVRQTPA
jgi:putative FmdB family regulatory protein